MISNFLVQKCFPLMLGILGVSCIDSPHNVIRKILLDLLDELVSHLPTVF